MGKKLLVFWMSTVLVLGMMLPAYGAQAGTTVAVRLPAFKVTLNGEVADPVFSQYPLIVYKDITYFPMTYSDCRFLGLETSWKGQLEGLSIDTTGVTAAYQPYKTTTRNSVRQTAVIPAYPIRINGQWIDQNKEPYPLLSFRNVTYFPITWKFGVEAFGWDYRFDADNGLVIQSDNIKLKQIKLSSDRPEIGSGTGHDVVAVTSEYIYYQGTKGRIMQAPLSNPLNAKMVYQLPIWSYGDGTTYVFAGLRVSDSNAVLFYHQGGAVMGSEYLIGLNPDGTTSVLNDSRYYIQTFGDQSVKYWVGSAPGGGELFVKTTGSDWRQVGSPDYLYGWAWRSNGGSSGGSGSESVYWAGEQLYLLAFNLKEDKGTTGIYRVNVRTSETVRVTDREVLGFLQEGDALYYQSGGEVYRYDLKTGRETLLKSLVQAPNSLQTFAMLGERMYWQDLRTGWLYDPDGKPVQAGAPLLEVKLKGDNHEFLACTFEDTPETKYKLMVINQNGEVVFKTSDKVSLSSLLISGQSIYYYNLTTGTVCVGVIMGDR
jgi:hypothetical protein